MDKALMQDPYAAIRSLGGFQYTPEQAGNGYGGEGGDGATPAQWTNHSGIPQEFGSKFQTIRDNGNGTQTVVMQAPGGGKYDVIEADFKIDPATGKGEMIGEPRGERRSSSAREVARTVEQGVVGAAKFVAAAGAMYGGATLAMGGAGAGAGAGGAAAGAGAAEGGVGTLGTIAAGSGEVGALGTMGQMAVPAAGAGAAAAAGGGAVGTGLSVADWLGIGSVAAGVLNKPKTPDTSGINAAAQQSAQQASDVWSWFKSEYEKTAPDRAAATARDAKIGDAQLEGMTFATQQAKDLAERNKTVFQPLEDKLVADANGYDTPERRAQAVAESTADVEGAYGRAQQANTRAMMRMGGTPGGAATAALAQEASLSKAKAVAGATGTATRNVEQQGHARMADAAALGKGVVSSQATQQQIAANAGSAGVNAGAGQVAAANSGVPIMQAGANSSAQALQTAGSLYGQAASIDTATRGQDLNFLGNAFNAYLKSDEKAKMKTGKVTDGKKELAEVMATPVDEGWEYRPDSGYDDGQEHTGPMAQDVRAKMGEEVAPGGTDIDMRKMGGKMLAAIQAVTRDVAELRDQMASRARMPKPAKTEEVA